MNIGQRVPLFDIELETVVNECNTNYVFHCMIIVKWEWIAWSSELSREKSNKDEEIRETSDLQERF